MPTANDLSIQRKSTTPIPLGLTLGFFKHLVTLHGGRDIFQNLSTRDVCMQFVRPYTRDSELSLVNQVHRHHPNANQYVKEATWFVSHAWSYKYLDVVDALTDFFDDEGLDSDNVAVWFCMFNNNQHLTQGNVVPFNIWVNAFQSALKAIGNVVMVLSPWNNPTTLTRTWCVFEIYVAIVTNARFEVALGKTQKREFLQDIQHDDSFLKMLGTIKSETSQTAVPSDRDHIVALMTTDGVTFADLDRMLFGVLEAWIFRLVQRQVDASTLAAKAEWLWALGGLFSAKKVPEKAQQCYDAAIDIFRDDLANEHPTTWRVVARAASNRHELGHARHEWEPMFQEALTCQVERYGKAIEDTLAVMYLFGLSYVEAAEYALGLPLIQECFERCDALFGDSIPLTAQAMTLVGKALLSQNRLHEAEWWVVTSYERHRHAHGADHPNTFLALSHLLALYSKQGKHAVALPHLHHSYETHRRIYGPHHLDTWIAYNNVGIMSLNIGEYTIAKTIFVACVDENVLALLTPDWQHMCMLYVGLVFGLGKFYCVVGEETDQAYALMTKSYDGFRHLYAPTHYYCRLALTWIAMLLYTPNIYFATVAQLTKLDADFREAGCFHETWTSMTCHGCYRPIQGLYVACPACPKFAWRFCAPCVTNSKHKAFCTHDGAVLVKLKPPARYLQEKRLTLLAEDGNWTEYDRYYQAYETYCATHQVRGEDRFHMRPSKFVARVLVDDGVGHTES
ncbi:Aste57867_23681 [Aphanomyces stellatus]|uniref:Aste57867_23681 protein n=1 Tax=Aphanomyces stellatus TaxID=120398 RepID=A0A485LNG3_9STRA|nr:hypothetical protein As57867_023609 [Aphanomyces stellatus]VFU00326.1 Aste57867_23681 [Aphanomyces stellatus]